MWNLEDKALFRSGALGAMRSNKKIDAPEMFIDAAIAQFMPNEDKPPVEEIMRFMEFIKDIEYHVRRYDAHELEIALQLPAGEGTISMALRANLLTYNDNAESIPPEQASIDISAVDMLKVLTTTYHAVRTAAPNLLPAASASATTQSSDNGLITEEHEADTLEVGSWKGQKTFRIRASWFSQYGAACYPETLKTCGYGSLIDLPVGTLTDFKHHITIQVKDGKPKVVKISS